MIPITAMVTVSDTGGSRTRKSNIELINPTTSYMIFQAIVIKTSAKCSFRNGSFDCIQLKYKHFSLYMKSDLTYLIYLCYRSLLCYYYYYY